MGYVCLILLGVNLWAWAWVGDQGDKACGAINVCSLAVQLLLHDCSSC